MKFIVSSTQLILSATLATLLLSSSFNVAHAQRISALLEHVKILSDGGVTIGGYRHHHKNFQEPIIKSADLIENAVQDAYWIDFHDQFTQRDKFSQLVASHPGITLRHEFWDSLNAVTVNVKNESVLKEILKQVQGIRQVEPVVRISFLGFGFAIILVWWRKGMLISLIFFSVCR